MKKIIPIILGLVIIAGMIGVGFAKGEGGAEANVTNAAPSIELQEIMTPSWSSVTTVVPNSVFYFNVSISDVDTAADILNTTILLQLSSNNLANDPSVTYEFYYNETLASGEQLKPDPAAVDTYLNGITRTTYGANTINYSFEVVLNKTATDSNGALSWHFRTTVIDTSYVSFSSDLPFAMGPYVEMTYWGNNGGMDFTWTGAAESNQTATFSTLVTSNDIYQLNASFTGDFGVVWGAPTMWIKRTAGTAILIPDATGSPGTNATWFTSTGPVSFWGNQSHSIALEFPTGIPQGAYSGVTIWIQARNG